MNPEHYMYTNIHYMVAAGWPIVDFIFQRFNRLCYLVSSALQNSVCVTNCASVTFVLVTVSMLGLAFLLTVANYRVHWTAILYSYSTPDPVSHLFLHCIVCHHTYTPQWLTHLYQGPRWTGVPRIKHRRYRTSGSCVTCGLLLKELQRSSSITTSCYG